MVAHWRAGTLKPSERWAGDFRPLLSRCKRGDARARETIIVSFLPYARQLARLYEGRGETVEDLYQAASEGLIKAVDRYQPERGVSFVSYARPVILGEIRRHFRDSTWRVHVPRSMQERAVRVARASRELPPRSGSDETTVIATHLSVEPREVEEARRVLEAYRPRSLDAEYMGNDGRVLTLGESVGEYDPGYEQVEAYVEFRHALEKLGARDREVLLLRISCELTQGEIAKRIGISQMQVSRILRKAIATATATPEAVPNRLSNKLHSRQLPRAEEARRFESLSKDKTTQRGRRPPTLRARIGTSHESAAGVC